MPVLKNTPPTLSVVCPVYQGEASLEALVTRIEAAVSPITGQFSVVLVNDASPDGSWEKIVRLCEKDPAVVGINLSRNFGQQQAIAAGLSYARNSQWVVVMDCDLQDRPEDIPLLWEKAAEGYDCVLAQRDVRYDSVFKKIGSKFFFRIFSRLTDTRQAPGIAEFGLYSQQVVAAILAMGDYLHYLPAQVQWVGFSQTSVPVVRDARPQGVSGYTVGKLIRLATDAIFSYSDKPLRWIVRLGLATTLLSLLVILYFFSVWLFSGEETPGYTSLILSLWLTLGVLSTILGIVGLYISMTFKTVQRRPPFIIKETRNTDEA
ncbi:MAG: glycosyltransferase family 2 protein [Bacteroidales bacterium]|nr:glycosyltransferase family 2 protein [Bacteroidales bacterium]